MEKIIPVIAILGVAVCALFVGYFWRGKKDAPQIVVGPPFAELLKEAGLAFPKHKIYLLVRHEHEASGEIRAWCEARIYDKKGERAIWFEAKSYVELLVLIKKHKGKGG